jgi:hypothetical protein
MSRDKRNISTVPYNLASLIRGLYGRVARQLKVDPSYVSRVARGERESREIEASLERELKRIMTLMRTSHDGAGRDGHKRAHGMNHDGAGRDGHKRPTAKAKTKKKARSLPRQVNDRPRVTQ